ncbi:MAG: hypothetical protein J0G96_01085 [Flavobacteriia bacterium]|nr:hypothetical protein [Flavobacteriia bacterium]OJX36078.1 MAG: hypothetical protein BGO87_06335 [Flavobacteriia bacterium 40-80]
MLIFVIVVTFLGCKSTRRNPIPNIPFDITINITLPAYIDLQNVGSYAYVTGGSKGLIVYRMSYDQFVAFDRHSPAEASFNCDQPLTPREENFLELSDSCSTARFSLLDGSAIEGSDVGLRQYLTYFDGANKVRIYN